MQPLAAPAVGGPWADESAAPTRAGTDGQTGAEGRTRRRWRRRGRRLGIRWACGGEMAHLPWPSLPHPTATGSRPGGAAPPFPAPSRPGRGSAYKARGCPAPPERGLWAGSSQVSVGWGPGGACVPHRVLQRCWLWHKMKNVRFLSQTGRQAGNCVQKEASGHLHRTLAPVQGASEGLLPTQLGGTRSPSPCGTWLWGPRRQRGRCGPWCCCGGHCASGRAQRGSDAVAPTPAAGPARGASRASLPQGASTDKGGSRLANVTLGCSGTPRPAPR